MGFGFFRLILSLSKELLWFNQEIKNPDYRNPNWYSLPKSERLTYLSVYDEFFRSYDLLDWFLAHACTQVYRLS